MTIKTSSDKNSAAPSIKERIEALYNHNRLFKMIDGCPQIGIHETFGREWALSVAHVEGEVHRCGRAVEHFLQKNAHSREPTPFEAEYKDIMNDLVHALLLHGM